LNPGVRVLLCSGYNEQDATNRFAGKGLAGFIQKPFRYDQLLKKVRDMLVGSPPADGDSVDEDEE
jgi:DNA-binding NtrC family response regulator